MLVDMSRVEGGRMMGGGHSWCVWWRQLVSLRQGKGMMVGRWINENLVRLVGPERSFCRRLYVI